MPTSKYSPATCGTCDLRLFGRAAAAISDPHVVQHDILQEAIADGVEHDALAGLARAVILCKGDIRELPALGDHLRADAAGRRYSG